MRKLENLLNMLVNFRKYIYYSLVKNTLHKFKSLIFRTPPDPRLKGDKLICFSYDEESMPPVRPIGSDGTRSKR